MPIFSFKERFVPFIKTGTKRQTIRKFRRYQVRKGQPITFVTGPRFKPVAITEKKPVDHTACVFISKQGRIFQIGAEWLTPTEQAAILERGMKACRYPYTELTGDAADAFAYADGFRHGYTTEQAGCFKIMLRWWQQTHELPFIGFITYW